MRSGGGERALQVKLANRWNGINSVSGAEAVGSTRRTKRRALNETPHSDDFGLQARRVVSVAEAIKIRIAADAFLDGLDVNDANRPVRTALPCPRSNE